MNKTSSVEIRRLEENDASAFLNCLVRIDNSTEYLLYEPGERVWNLDISKNVINQVNSLGIILGAFIDTNLIGYLLLQGNDLIKIRHSAQVVIAIDKDYRHNGIGKQLFEEAFLYAQNNQIKRIELSVLLENVIAKNFYKKLGFFEEGIKQKSILQNKQYVNEVMMAKFL